MTHPEKYRVKQTQAPAVSSWRSEITFHFLYRARPNSAVPQPIPSKEEVESKPESLTLAPSPLYQYKSENSRGSDTSPPKSRSAPIMALTFKPPRVSLLRLVLLYDLFTVVGKRPGEILVFLTNCGLAWSTMSRSLSTLHIIVRLLLL